MCQAFDSRAFQRVAPTSLAAALADGPHARCAPLRYQNTVPFSEPGARVCYCKSEMVVVKASILVPLRDILTSEPVWQIVFGHEACNAQEHEVSDPSFCTESWPEERTPERVARGGILSCPRALSKGDTIESGGRKLQFIGTPPHSRVPLVMPDHPDYPGRGVGSAPMLGRRSDHTPGGTRGRLSNVGRDNLSRFWP